MIVGDFLYVIGGMQTDGTKLASIERAAIRRDGSLGPFTAVPEATLAIARSDHTTQTVR